MIQAEELVGEEWAEWYRLTPLERWLESADVALVDSISDKPPTPGIHAPELPPATWDPY